MTTQRNEAIGQMEEQKHKVSLLQEHMTDLKIKLSRYQQEKMQSERHLQHLLMQHHSRGVGDGGLSNTTTWITPHHGTSNTSTGSTDTEYYQRKCNESNQKVQSYQAMLIEKNRQIDELRYQVERNMNQQQYTNFLQRPPGAPGLEHPSNLPSAQTIMDSTLLSSKRQRM
jgi:hypothetical protein